jgi:hypothetical protein
MPSRTVRNQTVSVHGLSLSSATCSDPSIAFETGTAHVRRAKGGQEATHPLLALQELKRQSASPFFASERGGPFTPSAAGAGSAHRRGRKQIRLFTGDRTNGAAWTSRSPILTSTCYLASFCQNGSGVANAGLQSALRPKARKPSTLSVCPTGDVGCYHYASMSSKLLAAFKSGVSNPSEYQL